MAINKRLIKSNNEGGGGLLNAASFYLNPRSITSDGTITTWQDEGTIGRDFSAVGTVRKYGTGTSIEYVAGDYGTDSKLFAGSATPTAYSDYNAQQSMAFGGFVNVPFGYKSGALSNANAQFYGIRPSHGNSDSYSNQISTYTVRRDIPGEEYKTQFSMRYYTSVRGAVTSTITLEPFPSWWFLCHTLDYNPSGTSTMKLFLNGVLNQTSTFTGVAGLTSNVLSVGAAYEDGGSYNRSGVFFGDTFGFLGTTKTDAEVLEIYDAYKAYYGL